PIALDLSTRSERVALSLHDQRGAAKLFQMRGAQVARLIWRMERVAEAHQTVDVAGGVQLVGGRTGDATAQRLAADEQLLPACSLRTQFFDCALILRDQQLCPWRWPPLSALPARRHIVELESR